ncbi:UV DNA damage repair endonuclease UvsE [Rubrivirga sp. IMCC45206]|uniref:UV DNA damage repair endonuclease UvsE n=1 Tax=Rubrivirga sp. IMCC45206 TaxID=3391614 RepID=UPI00398FA21E
MRLRHLGYACINTALGTKSRTVRLANLRTEAVIPVVVQNLDDVLAALEWNVARDLRFSRVSSDLIPFGPLDAFPFDWTEAFDWQFRKIRRLVKAEGLRVTSHPGQYTVLNSPRPEVVQNSIDELDFQAQVLKRMDPTGTMTLHVGGAYGDKPAALDRFEQALERLSDDARARLAIENDDTTYTLAETVGLAERTGLPVIVDLFHHLLNPSGATADDGLLDLMERAMATWGRRAPKLHLSSHKPGTRTGHADYLDMDDVDRLTELMDQVGAPDAPYDLMLEAKAKEQAVLEVRHYLTTGERPDRPIPMETVAEAEA